MSQQVDIANIDFGNLNFEALKQLDATTTQHLLSVLSPKLNKYIPHKPHPKQAVFMRLEDREAFYGGAAGGGKDIALTTPILTTEGWRTMEDVHPGDYVYGRDGLPVKVLAESEVFNHDCYEVTFDNRETIIAGGTHVWSVVTRNRAQRYKLSKHFNEARGPHLYNKTTLELLEETNNRGHREAAPYRIPAGLATAQQIEDTSLPIEPYLLGYWLGDGTTKDGIITTEDLEVVEEIRRLRPIHKAYKTSILQYRVDGLLPQLRDAGVYDNKHIPEAYMFASYTARLELLRGLMDSDGTIEARGVMSFCNTNAQLSEDVTKLLSTLGIKSGVSTIKAPVRGDVNYEFELRNTFSTTEKVFHLPRKFNRQKAELRGTESWYYINSITPTQSVPTKCIKVDAPDRLFRIGFSMILTHNSDALLMDALQNVDQQGYSAILFRKTYADLVKPGALIARAKEWLMHHEDVRWNEKEKKFEWIKKYGPHKEIISVLQFGYLDSVNDRFNYQGGEYQYVGFDEVTHIAETSYLYMFSRLRRIKGSTIPLKVRSASNPPDDDNGIWVYNRFVNPEKKKKGLIFIPAGLVDNPFLDEEEYRETLSELDPVTRARLRDGNWVVQRKGNMFKRDWFETVEAPPQYRTKVRSWDMAATDPADLTGKAKKNEDPDYTAGVMLSECQGIFYLEDIVNRQASVAVTQQLQRTQAIMDGYGTTIREEMEPGSSGKAVIDMKARTIFKGYNYKGVRSSGSKPVRASAFSAACENGLVKIVKGCRNVEAFLNQAESFPGGVHDDMVDAAAGAYNALREIPSFSMPVGVGTQEEEGSYWQEEIVHDGNVVTGYFSAM